MKEKIQLKNLSRYLFILSIASFFVGLDSIITASLLPLMAESIHVQKEMGALLVTAYAFVYMISAPIFGAISDQWGLYIFTNVVGIT